MLVLSFGALAVGVVADNGGGFVTSSTTTLTTLTTRTGPPTTQTVTQSTPGTITVVTVITRTVNGTLLLYTETLTRTLSESRSHAHDH